MAQDRKGGSVVGIHSSLKVWLLVCGRVMSLKEREKSHAFLGCGAGVRLSEAAYSPAMAEWIHTTPEVSTSLRPSSSLSQLDI